jgi:MFS transporter, UMF1 family
LHAIMAVGADERITPVMEHASMDAATTPAGRLPDRRSKGTSREIGAWAVYESASNAFNTLIITFIFSRYFQGVIAPDEAIGLTWWTRALNISAIVVALSMPVMGAIADFSGRKKQFLFVTTIGCIAATSLLFFMQPGMMLTAVLIFIVANVLFEAAAVFYNGFLPELTTTERMGRISGFGWSMGYVGGLICLIIALGMLRLWEPADPYLNVRATTLLAAVWYLVLAIPLFLMVRERQRRRSAPVRMYVEAGFRRVARTFQQLRTFREAAKLLLARLVYNDGLVVLFGMAAIYVGTVYGMGFDDIIVLAIVVNIAAAIGAFAFGFLNDIIGAKKTIAITLVVLTAATLLGATAPDMRTFWVAAIVIGLMVGPNQSASRAMLATFTPERKQGEFFGFFAFSGKLSSVAGPLAYGTVAAVTGSQRIAMASIMVFFIVGFALLMLVDEKRGVEMARKATLAGVGEES